MIPTQSKPQAPAGRTTLYLMVAWGNLERAASLPYPDPRVLGLWADFAESMTSEERGRLLEAREEQARRVARL